jgi:hypothetical protein
MRWQRICWTRNLARMSASDISQLSLREKFQIMEAIWVDLRGQEDSFNVPQSHKDLLDVRRARAASADSRILDWDQAKHTIGCSRRRK